MNSGREENDPVRKIVEILQLTRSVPMPGGHGYRFKELRDRLPDLGKEPPVAVRCVACLTMLCADENLGKWFRKGWLPFASAWFDQHATELARTLPAPRWRCMIEAMARLANTLGPYGNLGSDAVAKMHQYLKPRGLRQVQEEVTESSFAEAMPIPGDLSKKEPHPDAPINWGDRAWKLAASLLESDAQADSVLMLYVVHTFHCSIGVPQYSLDIFHKARIPLYRRMAELLESMSRSGCQLCAVAQRVAATLKTTRAYLGTEGRGASVRILEAQLPACFQPAHLHSLPPTRAGVARKLAHSAKSLNRLLEAHDLAELLADRVIDPVSISLYSSVRVFDDSNYLLLLDLLKYGSSRYREALTRGTLAAMEDLGNIEHVPIKRSAPLEHIVSKSLTGACAVAWKDLEKHPSWKFWSSPNRCIICLEPERGRAKMCSQENSQ